MHFSLRGLRAWIRLSGTGIRHGRRRRWRRRRHFWHRGGECTLRASLRRCRHGGPNGWDATGGQTVGMPLWVGCGRLGTRMHRQNICSPPEHHVGARMCARVRTCVHARTRMYGPVLMFGVRAQVQGKIMCGTCICN